MKAIIEIKDVAFREIGDINRGRGKPSQGLRESI